MRQIGRTNAQRPRRRRPSRRAREKSAEATVGAAAWAAQQGYKFSLAYGKAEEPTTWTTAEDAALWGVKEQNSRESNAIIYPPDGCTIRSYAHFLDWLAFVKMELEEKKRRLGRRLRRFLFARRLGHAAHARACTAPTPPVAPPTSPPLRAANETVETPVAVRAAVILRVRDPTTLDMPSANELSNLLCVVKT